MLFWLFSLFFKMPTKSSLQSLYKFSIWGGHLTIGNFTLQIKHLCISRSMFPFSLFRKFKGIFLSNPLFFIGIGDLATGQGWLTIRHRLEGTALMFF